MTLVERLEAATAGSRELDAEISRSIISGPSFAHWNGVHVSNWWLHDDGESWGCNTTDGWRHERCIRVSHYTTSLDAALTLVPDGYDYIIYRIDGEYYAEVGPTGSFGFTKCVGAPTIALAICIAALKARTP